MRTAEAPVTAAEASALFADLTELPALVLAVSGGPDSTALMWLAARWRARRKRGPRLIAVTVDHRLRRESAREAVAVGQMARRLGVDHRTLIWRGAKPSTGLQQAARQARYRLLAKAAREAGATHILTAHTSDDQAETVLFRLARGSGVAGLAGMARSSPLGPLTLVRPLLDIPKARLVATLLAAGVAFVEDPSNVDPRFARARLRPLLGALAAEGLSADRLATLARRVARVQQALEHEVDAAAARLMRVPASAAAPVTLEAADFAALPAEIGLRLLGRAVASRASEGGVELGKLESLFAALTAAESSGTGRLRRTLAGALVTSARGTLSIERAPPRRGKPR